MQAMKIMGKDKKIKNILIIISPTLFKRIKSPLFNNKNSTVRNLLNLINWVDNA